MGAMKEFLAELSVMAREAANDVRGTVHEAYFGSPEHASAVGTPMNPLQREVYDEKHNGSPQNTPDLAPERDHDHDM
jgi:hypothetical protein